MVRILQYDGCMNVSALPAKRMAPRYSGGFTMIELVVVMVLVAVLAFVAIPRLNVGSLQVVPVAEQIAAEIRYAQSLAMTRSETFTFTLSAGTYSIFGEDSGLVNLSDGRSSGSVGDASATPASIDFNPRFGKPTGTGSITVSGGGSSVIISIDSETGYVSL